MNMDKEIFPTRFEAHPVKFAFRPAVKRRRFWRAVQPRLGDSGRL